jgi:hypothetical protein
MYVTFSEAKIFCTGPIEYFLNYSITSGPTHQPRKDPFTHVVLLDSPFGSVSIVSMGHHSLCVALNGCVDSNLRGRRKNPCVDSSNLLVKFSALKREYPALQNMASLFCPSVSGFSRPKSMRIHAYPDTGPFQWKKYNIWHED